MHDDVGQSLDAATPSVPAQIIGLTEVPMAGDLVNVVADERAARDLVSVRRQEALAQKTIKSSATSIEELLGKVREQDTPEVPVIIKADTQGSVEAIAEALQKINTERVRNRVVHKAVGGVTESDISLSETSGGIIVAFNVRAGRGLDDEAERRGVPVRYFSVIYDLVTAIKSVMEGKLPPILTEVIQGHGEVRATIKVPKIGLVAGTAITDGKITRQSHLRLIRDDVVIYSGRVGSLRRFKDDVKEVVQGYECGIGIEGCNDIREGDVIESYIIQEERPTL
jgi:translation initiation factor IF-2